MSEMNMKCVEVKGLEKKDLLDALELLSQMDADFYEIPSVLADEEFEEKGFVTKSKSLLDKIKNIEDESDESLIIDFVSEWINGDDYYEEYDIQVILDENKKAKFIALATLSK